MREGLLSNYYLIIFQLKNNLKKYDVVETSHISYPEEAHLKTYKFEQKRQRNKSNNILYKSQVQHGRVLLQKADRRISCALTNGRP